MYNLIEFEDLGGLDGGDLRAVLSQAGDPCVLAALGGASPALRQLLLMKLPGATAARLEIALRASGPVSPEAGRAAQAALIETLRRLGREGRIAFSDPHDIMTA